MMSKHLAQGYWSAVVRSGDLCLVESCGGKGQRGKIGRIMSHWRVTGCLGCTTVTDATGGALITQSGRYEVRDFRDNGEINKYIHRLYTSSDTYTKMA